jgi:hypothetical protein
MEPVVFKIGFFPSPPYVFKLNIPKIERMSNADLYLRKMIQESDRFRHAEMVRIFNINYKPYILKIIFLDTESKDTEKHIDVLLLDIILHFEPGLLDDTEKIENLKKDYIYNKDSALSSLGFSILRQILSKVPIELIYCK